MTNLIDAFKNASLEEQNAFYDFIKGGNSVSDDVYSAMKKVKDEEAQAAAKQAEIQKGYKLRDESAKKFQAKFGQL